MELASIINLIVGLAITVIGYFLKSALEESKINSIQIMNLKQTNAELTLKIAEVKENSSKDKKHIEEIINLKLDNISIELRGIKDDLKDLKGN
jgi:hypothetical protein